MYGLAICAMLLLHGAVDLIRLALVVLHRRTEIDAANRLRLKFAVWQTVIGGLGLLVALWAGFMIAIRAPA